MESETTPVPSDDHVAEVNDVDYDDENAPVPHEEPDASAAPGDEEYSQDAPGEEKEDAPGEEEAPPPLESAMETIHSLAQEETAESTVETVHPLAREEIIPAAPLAAAMETSSAYSRGHPPSILRVEEPFDVHTYTHKIKEENRCIGAFGFGTRRDQPAEVERALAKYGPIEKTDFILDTKSGKYKGFGFIYFQRLEDAVKAISDCDGRGMIVGGLRVRLDYSKNALTAPSGPRAKYREPPPSRYGDDSRRERRREPSLPRRRYSNDRGDRYGDSRNRDSRRRHSRSPSPRRDRYESSRDRRGSSRDRHERAPPAAPWPPYGAAPPAHGGAPPPYGYYPPSHEHANPAPYPPQGYYPGYPPAAAAYAAAPAQVYPPSAYAQHPASGSGSQQQPQPAPPPSYESQQQPAQGGAAPFSWYPPQQGVPSALPPPHGGYYPVPLTGYGSQPYDPAAPQQLQYGAIPPRKPQVRYE